MDNHQFNNQLLMRSDIFILIYNMLPSARHNVRSELNIVGLRGEVLIKVPP